MAVTYYESAKHPLASTVVRPFHIRSESKGSSGTNIVGIDDVTVPASANFPSTASGASTSYYIYLDWDIYKTSTNSTDFSVRNETQGVDLTIVDPSVGLTNYTCKFYSTTSERRNVLEVHVGSTSNQASDSLSLEGFASASVITANKYNNIDVNSAETSTTVIINSGGLGNIRYFEVSSGVYAGSTKKLILQHSVHEFFGWNMNTDATFDISLLASFSDSNWDKNSILDMQVIIYPDTASTRTNSDFLFKDVDNDGDVEGGVKLAPTSTLFTLTQVTLYRHAGSYFNSTYYESTTLPRGKIFLTYLTSTNY